MEIHPLVTLLIGLIIVIGMILVIRINAFFALITAALAVSLLAPGELSDKIGRVAIAFGSTAGSIGIVIALAAVIGMCMLESHAADRIVRWFLTLFGVKRGDVALLASGFILSIPVFFDTVFYLLIPLARSMFQRTGKDYPKYVMVIAAGALVTHGLVPPTPGPLINAQNLGVDLGTMIMVGLLVAAPAAFAGILAAGWLNARLDIPMRPLGEMRIEEPPPDDQLPGLAVSLLPIVLPVVLIATNTITEAVAPDASIAEWTAVLGNPNLAMFVAATVALTLYAVRRQPPSEEFTRRVESALMSGGLIILITSAGGAFGAMLQAAEIGPAIQGMFGDSAASGFALLLLGFFIATLLKIAQGSSTVAIITTSAMLGSMISPGLLGFHPVYLATAIGSGSMVGSWMNDSGFWIISKMGVLTEIETFQTWSAVAAVVGVAAMITTIVLATLMPLT
jgi:GntP family gluconate:H+ symporter